MLLEFLFLLCWARWGEPECVHVFHNVCEYVYVYQKKGKGSCQVQPCQSQLIAVSFACQIGVIGGGTPESVAEWDWHHYAENVPLSGEHL